MSSWSGEGLEVIGKKKRKKREQILFRREGLKEVQTPGKIYVFIGRMCLK